MTPVEFSALFKRHELRVEREDWRTGSIQATMANLKRDKKRRSRPYTARDFMPTKEPRPNQTWQQQLALVELMTVARGGKDEREGSQRL